MLPLNLNTRSLLVTTKKFQPRLNIFFIIFLSLLLISNLLVSAAPFIKFQKRQDDGGGGGGDGGFSVGGGGGIGDSVFVASADIGDTGNSFGSTSLGEISGSDSQPYFGSESFNAEPLSTPEPESTTATVAELPTIPETTTPDLTAAQLTTTPDSTAAQLTTTPDSTAAQLTTTLDSTVAQLPTTPDSTAGTIIPPETPKNSDSTVAQLPTTPDSTAGTTTPPETSKNSDSTVAQLPTTPDSTAGTTTPPETSKNSDSTVAQLPTTPDSTAGTTTPPETSKNSDSTVAQLPTTPDSTAGTTTPPETSKNSDSTVAQLPTTPDSTAGTTTPPETSKNSDSTVAQLPTTPDSTAGTTTPPETSKNSDSTVAQLPTTPDSTTFGSTTFGSTVAQLPTTPDSTTPDSTTFGSTVAQLPTTPDSTAETTSPNNSGSLFAQLPDSTSKTPETLAFLPTDSSNFKSSNNFDFTVPNEKSVGDSSAFNAPIALSTPSESSTNSQTPVSESSNGSTDFKGVINSDLKVASDKPLGDPSAFNTPINLSTDNKVAFNDDNTPSTISGITGNSRTVAQQYTPKEIEDGIEQQRNVIQVQNQRLTQPHTDSIYTTTLAVLAQKVIPPLFQWLVPSPKSAQIAQLREAAGIEKQKNADLLDYQKKLLDAKLQAQINQNNFNQGVLNDRNKAQLAAAASQKVSLPVGTSVSSTSPDSSSTPINPATPTTPTESKDLGSGLKEVTTNQDLNSDFTTYANLVNANYCPPLPQENIVKLGSDAGVTGFAFESKSTNKIVISFKGRTTNFSPPAKTLVPYVDKNGKAYENAQGATVNSEIFSQYINDEENLIKQLTPVLGGENANLPIIVAGFDTGAGHAIFTALALKRALNNRDIKVYTYGESRLGNPAFAGYVDNSFSGSVFRITNNNDPNSNLPSTADGYQHHTTEYWQIVTSQTQRLIECSPFEGAENQKCNARFTQAGQSSAAAHNGPYFGVVFGECPTSQSQGN
ncbi:hypothetical protein G9A89_015712 [Geosiphon pyriformis]|nr:hypothetical protein G9A89_015712 [Geosiphon pyriformis]